MENDPNPDPKAAEILDTYAANAWLARSLAAEITHEESLLQLPFPANCLNWVVGHIINGRCTALRLLDAEPVWGEEIREMYRTGSAPIVDGSGVVPLETLFEDLEESQGRLNSALLAVDRGHLEEMRTTERGEKRVEDHLSGLAWHETFHVGQIDILAAYAKASRD